MRFTQWYQVLSKSYARGSYVWVIIDQFVVHPAESSQGFAANFSHKCLLLDHKYAYTFLYSTAQYTV